MPQKAKSSPALPTDPNGRIAVSLRFDADVAGMLRKRSQEERRSINTIVNEIMRQNLQHAGPADQHNVLALLPNHVRVLQQAMKQLQLPQETAEDTNKKTRDAIEALERVLSLVVLALEPRSFASSSSEILAGANSSGTITIQ